MSTVYTGFTNLDNTGSKLDAYNASVNLAPGTFANVADVQLSDSGEGVAAINNGAWNQADFKEAEVSTDKTSIFIENFVDVSVEATSDEATTVEVVAAKRGTITTGSGDDEVNVSVYSNENTWDNTLHINTGAGDDIIVLDGLNNSQYTEYSIQAGEGNDTVDVSGLLASVDNNVAERFVDGGEGFDTLVISGEDTLTFANFTVIEGGEPDAALTLTEALLLANDTYGDPETGDTVGLIFSDVDIKLGGNLSIAREDVAMTDLEHGYLVSEGESTDHYTAYLIADVNGNSHTILTDDTDILA